jgi:hypothetical protein
MLKKEAHLKNQTNIDLKETDFANKIKNHSIDNGIEFSSFIVQII